MRVGQFGLEVKFEVRMEGKIFTSEFQDFTLSFFDERSGNNGHENGINIFSHVFNQSRVTIFNGNFKFSVNHLGSKT